ncbi:PiggyBac transposable element-derived protein 4 [Cucumispora dikerogammari]|nr:PiggyBac transposable element-derived protein 4 [Cucumispora dikerogammari]
MGVVRKPTIESYWSGNALLATPFFQRTMKRDRFSLLLKFLHFSDSNVAPQDDKLYKLREICDIIRRRIQEVYIPEKEISIDESMVLWRGRLMFRQYIPGKKHKYGVKLYELCDRNGYVWNASIYCGKEDRIAGVGHSEAVVKDLIDPLLDKGYHLYVDNFYTGIPLAKDLMEHNTHVCGTLRRNRKFLPKNVVTAKLTKGQVVKKRSGQITLLKWKEKRDVLMLTTMHTGHVVQSTKLNRKGELIHKPNCIMDYNKYICGVDRADQLASYYDPLRKTLKWYRKVVFHFMDIALCNAYILYKKLGGKKKQIWFNLQVIEDLIHGSADLDGEHVDTSPKYHHKASDETRLVGKHSKEHIPPTTKKQHPTKFCVICHKRGLRRESRYCCKTCVSKPALCIDPCFEEFHI